MEISTIFKVATIFSPIGIIVALGWHWKSSNRHFDVPFTTNLCTTVATPCLIFGSLCRSEISGDAAIEMLAASAVVFVVLVAIALLSLRAAGLSISTYMAAMVFPNSGNIGLPIALFAFGKDGLSYAIVFYALCTTLMTVTGEALNDIRQWRKMVLKSPIVWATVAGLSVSISGVPVPVFVQRAAELVGGLAIPLLLLALGVQLHSMRVNTLGRALVMAFFRIAVGAMVGYACSLALGLSTTATAVLTMQSSGPAAVYTYLIAQKHNRSPHDIAAVVAVSTAMSLVSIPLLLFFLIPTVE